jgi:hypothetical protein
VAWGPLKYLGIPKQTEVIEDENGNVVDRKLISEYIRPTIHPKLFYDNIQFVSIVLEDKYNLALTRTMDLYVWGTSFFFSLFENLKFILNFQGLFDAAYQHEMKKCLKERQKTEDFLEKNLRMPKKIIPDANFESVSCSKNHCLAIRGGKIFSWGIDGNTGRLGLGYEYFDEEEANDKKNKLGKHKKEERIMKDLDEIIELPENLNYLNTFLAKKFGEDKKTLQSMLFEGGKGSFQTTSNSLRDKSSNSSGFLESQAASSLKKNKNIKSASMKSKASQKPTPSNKIFL